jgi:imidazolonepropionase
MTRPAHPTVEKLWVNAHLATMTGENPYGRIPDGALATASSKIAWIGRRPEVPPEILSPTVMVHDARGCWITPGLIDCHTHLVHAGSRAHEFEARLKGVSYEAIARGGGGIRATVRATRTASEKELFAQSARRLFSFLAEGVTHMEVKSGYGLDLETELRMLRVCRRLGEEFPVVIHPTFLGAHAVPPEFEGRGDDYLDFVCREVLPAVVEADLAEAVDAFCDSIGFTAAQTERLFQAAQRFGLPVKLHAEQLSDSKGAFLAARYRALSADHLEHVHEDGVRAMAQAGVVAVLLPGAYFTLRDTCMPPVGLLRAHGVPMAVASDSNPGTCPSASLLLMLNMASVLFRLTPEEALAGVTRNAARALGILDHAGTLEVGKDADFVLWDIGDPAELSYRLGGNPMVAVIHQGEDTTAEVRRIPPAISSGPADIPP